MKKFISLILVLTLALSLAFTAFAAQSFSDVNQSHWAYGYIEYAASKGIVNGMGNGLFEPEGTLTAAQFITIITRAFYGGEAENSSAVGEWYAPYVETAENHGLLGGVGTADLDSSVTRFQMAQIIYNTMSDLGWDMLSDTDAKAVLSAVADGSTIPAGYASAVANVYNLDIITGMDSAGTFAGQESMTRAQAATVYYRMVKIISGTDDGGVDPDKIAHSGLTAPEAQLTVASAVYSLCMSEAELTEIAGEPDDRLETFAGYTWYVYGTDTYDDFFMAGVYGSKVVALCSSGVSFSYMGYTAGTSGLSQKSSNSYASFYTDSNDNGILHTVYLTDKAVFTEKLNTSAQALEGESRAVFYLTNAFRHYHGLETLKWSEQAATAAVLHSRDMAAQGYFSHDSLDGRTPWDRMAAQGISYRAAAENIIAGYKNAVLACNGWINSSLHRDNMLNIFVSYLGVGFEYSAGSYYRYYGTQDFYG